MLQLSIKEWLLGGLRSPYRTSMELSFQTLDSMGTAYQLSDVPLKLAVRAENRKLPAETFWLVRFLRGSVVRP